MTTKQNQTAGRELYCLSCASMLRTSASGCGRWYCSECHSVWESEDLERGDSATREESEPSVPTKPLEFYDDPDHFPGNQAPSKPDRDRIVEEAQRRFGYTDSNAPGVVRFAAVSFETVVDFVLAAAVRSPDPPTKSGNGLCRELKQLRERCELAEAETTRIGRELLRLREQPTLRDQLAMAALQGLVSTLQYHPDCGLPCHQGALTDDAYKIADAALKARNQPPAESK